MRQHDFEFEPGELVLASGTTITGMVVRSEPLVGLECIVLYDVTWTGSLCGAYTRGWSPCELEPLDAARRQTWATRYPDHAVGPWHKCDACVVRATVDAGVV